jgi:hypothetical protein
MKTGGVIRLVCPDLGLWIKKYSENDTDFFNKYYKVYINDPLIKTKGGIFSAQIFGFQHKWCYDFESIKDLMEKAGFVNVSRKGSTESAMPAIKNIESGDEGRIMESFYVEGVKP